MVVDPTNSRRILLDGEPFLMRGVAYSPTPIGVDPGKQSLDFFSDTYQRIYDRDLPLMAAAGINTVRGPRSRPLIALRPRRTDRDTEPRPRPAGAHLRHGKPQGPH